MRDKYTGSLSEKLDYETQEGRAIQHDARRAEEERQELVKKQELDAEYRKNLPGICMEWLRKEINDLEISHLSMIMDESKRKWNKHRMESVVEHFFWEERSIYVSAGMSEEWLRERCEDARQKIRNIAFEE